MSTPREGSRATQAVSSCVRTHAFAPGLWNVGGVVLPEVRLGQREHRAGEARQPAAVESPVLVAAEVEVVAEQRAEDVVTAVAVEAAVRDEQRGVEPRVVATLEREVAMLDHDRQHLHGAGAGLTTAGRWCSEGVGREVAGTQRKAAAARADRAGVGAVPVEDRATDAAVEQAC